MNPMFIDRNMFKDYGLVAAIKTTGVQLLEPLQETVVEVKVDGLQFFQGLEYVHYAGHYMDVLTIQVLTEDKETIVREVATLAVMEGPRRFDGFNVAMPKNAVIRLIYKSASHSRSTFAANLFLYEPKY